MSNKVDPNLIRELEEFGLKDASKCYNCGTCTAICDLATPENPFPRKLVRYIQLGQKEKILKSPEPWLCYYCGDCSTRCPRGADPGETMMVLRRYLTSLYDWTGFARKFYTSETFEIIAVAIVGILVGIGLLVFHSGPINWTHADLNSVWPSDGIEKADLVMAAILSFFLLTNVYRCMKIVMGDYFTKVPVGMYLDELKLLLHQPFHSETVRQMQGQAAVDRPSCNYDRIFCHLPDGGCFGKRPALRDRLAQVSARLGFAGRKDRVLDLPPDPADRLLCARSQSCTAPHTR